MSLIIRRWTTDDEIPPLTEMLHRAYAELAAVGFHYVAVDQDDATTLKRLSEGDSYLAELDGVIVGTITIRHPGTTTGWGCDWYETPGVAMFTQFAVDPSTRRQGIGTQLLTTVENRAIELGATDLACDTAEQAFHLIEMYRKFGYKVVATADWAVTNYRSVILNKTLPVIQ